MIFCNIYRERERDHTHKSFRFVSIWMCALLQWDIFSATQLSLSRRPLCQCWRICSCKWTSVAVSTHFITPRFLIRMGIFGPSFLNGSTKVPHFLGEGKMKPWSPTTPPPETNKGGSPEANQNISPLKRKNFSGDDKTLFCKIRWVHFSKVLLDVMLQIFQPKKRFDESISIPSPLETSLWCD